MTSQEDLAGVKEGDVLAGRYRVDKILGVGGMGVVVAAHHIQLDERVAIKFLLPTTLGNREAVMRFAREARAAVKIKSEHVARVSDVGTLENGAPYMVMEFLDGGDLSAWLKNRGALPVEQATEFVLQACEAIAEAHALGIVHRDLKPANLVVIRRADGVLSVKVLDFGISKMASAPGSGGDSSMTRTSAMMGSPLYMSPEQMHSSKDVDARGDIWALGVILFELLTGEVPFTGDSMPELILRIVNASPQPLRTLRPDVPERLEAVILRCLEKDRGKRYPTVGQLAVDLLPFAPKRAKSSVERISGVLQAAGMSASALALPPSSDAAQETASPAGTGASWGRTGPATSPNRTHIAVGLGLVAALVVGAAAMLRNGGAPLRTESSGSPLGPTTPSALTPASAASPPSPPSPVPVVAAATAVTAQTVLLRVSPPTAAVEVDGTAVTVAAGAVEIRGGLGSVHRVRARANGHESSLEVIIADTGAVPPQITVSGQAAPRVTREPAAPVKPPPPQVTPAKPLQPAPVAAPAPVPPRVAKPSNGPALEKKFE